VKKNSGSCRESGHVTHPSVSHFAADPNRAAFLKSTLKLQEENVYCF